MHFGAARQWLNSPSCVHNYPINPPRWVTARTQVYFLTSSRRLRGSRTYSSCAALLRIELIIRLSRGMLYRNLRPSFVSTSAGERVQWSVGIGSHNCTNIHPSEEILIENSAVCIGKSIYKSFFDATKHVNT